MKAMSVLVVVTVFTCMPQHVSAQVGYDLLQQALVKEQTQGDLEGAIAIYRQIVRDFSSDRVLIARTLVQLGRSFEKLGSAEARRAYERVVREYPEQSEMAAEARSRLLALAREGEDARKVGARRVWEGAIDYAFTGAPSPDGRYISYRDWETGALGVRDLSSGVNRLLTPTATPAEGEAVRSIFSPDGAKVAYWWIRYRAQRPHANELRVVALDGTAPAVVLQGAGLEAVEPRDWAPDGDILTLVTTESGTLQIAIVSVSGTVRMLKAIGEERSDRIRMRFSPDGRSIAYSLPSRSDSPARDVFLLASDGSRETPVVEHPADDFVLGWAPDGERLVFLSDRTGALGAWAVRVVDGRAIGTPQLLHPNIDGQPLGMTRDGSYYFGVLSGWSDVFTAELDFESGDVVLPPTQPMGRYQGSNSAPDWSADGEYLVSRSSRGARPSVGDDVALLVLHLPTGVVREVPVAGVRGLNFHFMRWAPDGRSVLAVGAEATGPYGSIFQIDVPSGAWRTLVRPDSGDAHWGPQWAPDGRVLFFVRDRGGVAPRRIIRRDVTSGDELELYVASGGVNHLTVSPDGRWLAFREGSAIQVLSTAGGAPREVLRIEQAIRTIAWTRDGTELLYAVPSTPDNLVELWAVPSAGGTPRKLDLAMPALLHLRVHPDGRRIAFTARAQEEKSEVWVLENFIPAVAGR